MGRKRFTVKKAYFVEREIDLACHILNASPKSVIDAAEQSGTKNCGAESEFGESLLQWVVGVSIGRFRVLGKSESIDGPNASGVLLPRPIEETSNTNACWAGESFATNVRNAISQLWRESDSVEHGLLEVLNVPSIERYLESAFFDHHLSLHSRSRRSAPIYWPISTESGSYTLWFYYHRLTDQTLYEAVNDFVDPKLKQTLRQLADLRAIKDRSSSQEKELAQLTELESELEQFKADLLEIAAIWKPNLNDGVQITAAPLWKFFRLTKWRNKLKKTWSELESGKYDWAHLALSIWPDRVVREKCTTDRSIAIAHDLEDQLWHEVEVRKNHSRRPRINQDGVAAQRPDRGRTGRHRRTSEDEVGENNDETESVHQDRDLCPATGQDGRTCCLRSGQAISADLPRYGYG